MSFREDLGTLWLMTAKMYGIIAADKQYGDFGRGCASTEHEEEYDELMKELHLARIAELAGDDDEAYRKLLEQ